MQILKNLKKLLQKSESREVQIDTSSILKEDISERIQTVEEYSEIKFPNSYISFIKENNVGVPITNRFTSNNHSYVVDRFLGFVNEYKTSSLGAYDIAVVLSEIDTRLTDNPDLEGDELIPIAILFAGDYVCLDFTENKSEPSVCIWSHEESEEFEPVTYKVADTFSDFIALLEE